MFICLVVGSEYKDETERKKLEESIIQKNNFFYNVGLIKKDKDKYKKAIKYKNTFYPSISEASINLKLSETSIRRKLKISNNKEFEYVNKSEWSPQLLNIEKAKSLYINGVYYRNERYASEQTGINRRTLRRHLNSTKYDYCYYA